MTLSLVIIHRNDGSAEAVTIGGVALRVAEWRHDARAGVTVARVVPPDDAAWRDALRRWWGEGT